MIEFDTGSIYCTSHVGISGVPGIVLDGILKDISATSQRIVPDEGRSEIGSMSFSLVDRSSAVTNEFRAKLVALKGLRGKTVRLYRGFEGFTWSEFSLFQTQVIYDAEFDFGTYKIECADITREQRKEIFEPKATTLRLSCTDTDTTIAVYDTSAFLGVEHGAAWSDGPSGTYVYFKVQDEIIRAPVADKTPDSFTNCTRGALNTRAKAHAVDAATAADQRTKVEEVIYLELPAAKLAYAILTGVIHGTSGTLPDHWHLGISPSMVELADFTGIGTDLWDTSDDAKGLPLRFAQEKAQDGKAFLEKQVYTVMGCFSPVYADGKLGLRRMAALTSDAAAVLTLTEDHIVSHSGLSYDMPGLINDFQIDWSYDGKEPRRRSRFVDQASVAVHGRATLKKLEWRGIYGSKATDVTIWQRLFALRDRYSAPPERLQAKLLASLSGLEVGDVVKLNVKNLRDFAGSGSQISRAFEVQRISLNHSTGDLDVDLFGSTARPSNTPPADITAYPLPDAFYSAIGTALNTVSGVTIAAGVMTAAPATPIGGNADMNNAGAVFYHLGDLTIQNGVTLKIQHNCQLRVMGYLTINGTIDGNYAGLAGVSDDGAVEPYLTGNPGFIGNSRGLDGLRVTEMSGNPQLESQPIPTTQGRFDAFPFLTLAISGNTLQGIPSDLRGTGGGPGGKVIYQSSLRANGGAGGAGGAGLCIISRGGTFGGSGQITLRGADTAAPSPHLEQGKNFYPGTGGAGGPGALLWLMDTGPAIAAPDVTGKFYGVTGTVAQPFYSAEFPILFMPSRAHQRRSRSEQPYAGYLGPEIISAQDISSACHRIQYIPPTIVPRADVDDPPPAPLSVTAVPGPGYNLITIIPAETTGATVELYESLDGNVANATPLPDLYGTQFFHALLFEETRYYHARSKLELDANTVLYSPWYAGTVVSKAGAAIAQDILEEPDYLETFEHQDVLGRYDSTYGSGTVSYPANGSFGGRVLRVAGGTRALVHKTNFPFDPSGVYRMSVRVRQVVASTNGLNDRTYAGFLGIAADGVTGLYAGGSEQYPAARAFDLGSVPLGTWVTLTGYFTGQSTQVLSPAPLIDQPSGVIDGTAYFRPVIWANYLDGDGTQEFDYLRTEKLIAGRWKDIDGEGKPADYADNTFTEQPSASGVFLDTFEHQNIDRYYRFPVDGFVEDEIQISYPANGLNGGLALQVTGYLYREWRENIPYDPDAVYRTSFRFRVLSDGSSGSNPIVIGYAGVAADGVTYINRVGGNSYATQHYQIDFFSAPIGSSNWVEVTAWFGGHGAPVSGTHSTDDPMLMYPGVKYFRPIIEFNRNSTSGGTVELDFIRIDKLVQPWQIAPGAAFETYQASTSSTDVYNSGSTSTEVASISVPIQSAETTQIVTVTGSVDHNAGSGTQGSTFALITDSFTSGQSYATEDTIARNPSTSLLRTVQTFTLERKFTVPSGTSKTYSLSALGMGFSASGSSCLLKSVTITAKVHRA